MRLFAFVILLPALSFAQVPHTFQNGDVADADKINQNFNYVLENGSGGCSATQQDNSVLIECADGTSGVIAGAGTVVVIPDGVIGDVADINEIPGGDIVWVDADDRLLAEIVLGSRVTYANVGKDPLGFDIVGILFNDDQTNEVVLHSAGISTVYYTSEDCTGDAFATQQTTSLYGRTLHDIDGNLYVRGAKLGSLILAKSSREGGKLSTSFAYTPTGPCFQSHSQSTHGC